MLIFGEQHIKYWCIVFW